MKFMSFNEMGRTPRCETLNVKKGLWTAEEDTKLLAYVSEHGTSNWTLAPKKAGLKRCGKSCRLRWTNYLRPDLKQERFTPEEETLIINLHEAIGSRWSQIAAHLPGRTDNDVKNYWNTKLKKKLLEMGIDPVTHKSFNQILAEYENIAQLPKAITQIGSCSRDITNIYTAKSKLYSVLEGNISNLLNHSTVAMGTPTMESVQDGLPVREGSKDHSSWDFQDQHKTMKLVKEATNCTNEENIHPYFLSEGSSSSSSSTTTAMQVNWPPPFACDEPSLLQAAPDPSFSWNEFLIKEPFLLPDQQEQQDFQATLSTSLSSRIHDEIPKSKLMDESSKTFSVEQIGSNRFNNIGESYPRTDEGEPKDIFQGSVPSNNSFMETIFDQDNQISWEFPYIFGEPFN